MSPKLILLVISSYIFSQISIRTINQVLYDGCGKAYYRNYNKLSIYVHKILSIILFGTIIKRKVSLWFLFMQIVSILGGFIILGILWKSPIPTMIQTIVGYGIGIVDLICIISSLIDDFINNKT